MAELLPISLIMPTRNRAAVLRRTLPLYLHLPVAQLVVVDDASADETRAVVTDSADARILYHRAPRRLYQPAARNVGIGLATQPYVLMGEDDVLMDAAYVQTLWHELATLPADVVAGRLISLLPGESAATALARSDAAGRTQVVYPARFAFDFACRLAAPLATPCLHACSLFARELALRHPYHEDYRGNALREESDFYLTVHAAGARLYFCSAAVCYHLPHDYGGGCRDDVVRYTLAGIRNNHHFVRRHWPVLRQVLGLSGGPWRYALGLDYWHARLNLGAWLARHAALLHRLVRRGPAGARRQPPAPPN